MAPRQCQPGLAKPCGTGMLVRHKRGSSGALPTVLLPRLWERRW